jgi:hypothetical protein
LTTEKDAARIQSDAALGELAARTRVLPISLKVAENETLREMVLGVCKRAEAQSFKRPGA